MQAKPIICAQHPATAAPPAKPVKPSAAQIAAEEIGSVNAIPTSTDIKYLPGILLKTHKTSHSQYTHPFYQSCLTVIDNGLMYPVEY